MTEESDLRVAEQLSATLSEQLRQRAANSNAIRRAAVHGLATDNWDDFDRIIDSTIADAVVSEGSTEAGEAETVGDRGSDGLAKSELGA